LVAFFVATFFAGAGDWAAGGVAATAAPHSPKVATARIRWRVRTLVMKLDSGMLGNRSNCVAQAPGRGD
jgi:hypothetical protein